MWESKTQKQLPYYSLTFLRLMMRFYLTRCNVNTCKKVSMQMQRSCDLKDQSDKHNRHMCEINTVRY